jgi:hypothetical protein
MRLLVGVVLGAVLMVVVAAVVEWQDDTYDRRPQPRPTA